MLNLSLLFDYKTASVIQEINNSIIKNTLDAPSSRTRYNINRAGSSCRVWQMIFCILNNLNERGYGINEMIECYAGGYYSQGNDVFIHKYDYIIGLLIYIYNNARQHEILYDLVYSNQPMPDVVQVFNGDITTLPVGNNYMCIYTDGLANSINHYFNIIKVSEDEYYLNSSYGSDWVCVPPYTTQITPDEFSQFFLAFNVNNRSNNEIVAKFYNKFFLTGNLGRYVDEDTVEAYPERWSETIKPNMGNTSQIQEIIDSHNRNNYRIGLMPNYCDYVGEVISSVLPMYESESENAVQYVETYGQFTPFEQCAVPGFGAYAYGGKKRRTRITRRNKRKTTKKNTKRARKTTKRRHSSRSSKRCSR